LDHGFSESWHDAVNKGKRGVCVYCGARGQVTRDHVPPKCLFAEPLPPNLITVSACHNCHRVTTKDDEYFRNTIALRDDVYDHPGAKAILPAIWRSLEKPKALGLRKSFVRAVSMVDDFTKSGIYLGKRPAYDVSLDRLNVVASRILRGLFSVVSEARLPSNYGADAYEASGFRAANSQGIDELHEMCRTVLSNPIAIERGDSVFACWWAPTDLDKNTSLWIMAFFKKIAFIGFTGPAERLPKRAIS
jgi:hypothetical protein